jgi:ABC-type methionine transport system ATPase subunit
LTLSGGQKARVTLARAVYSSAEILLLDDVLAALDVHTSKWIVDKCFRGDLLRGRTVLLVTHNVALTAPLADFVVSLGPDGRVRAQGSVADVLARDAAFEQEMAHDREVLAEAATAPDAPGEPAAADAAAKPASDGKLIMKEEIAEGHVSWSAREYRRGLTVGLEADEHAVKLYFSSLAESWTTVFWLLIFVSTMVNESLLSVQTW